MRTLLSFLSLLLSIHAFSQVKVWPGGVSGAVQWLITDTVGGAPMLQSHIADYPFSIHPAQGRGEAGYLNFHPSVTFRGNGPLQLDLGSGDLSGASYFTVYQCKDTSTENGIWYTGGNGKVGLVLTTARMADLGANAYMNYTDRVRDNPKVNTYIQQKQKDSTADRSSWYIGGSPASPRLPIRSFNGSIPELVLYDRPLSGEERLRVASYLAVKYGVTLSEPNATYLNSAGFHIWDGLQYSGYHHNIAGIGRDDSSGLQQTVACSGNTPGLLTIAMQGSLTNLDFLLWGDNSQPLTPGKKEPGQPVMLQRRWLMVSGNGHPYITDVTLDTRQIDAPLPVHPVYWLVLDGTKYIRMSGLGADGQAHFQDLRWDMQNGKTACGIIAGPGLLLTTHIDNPGCTSAHPGRLQVKVLGGVAPYRLSVTSDNSLSMVASLSTEDSTFTIASISPGKYRLWVSDALQNSYADSFYINSTDAPSPAMLDDSYTLPPTGKLIMDAGGGMPAGITYQWTGPENFQSAGPQVAIAKPGTYTLECIKDGCSSRQDIIVKSPSISPFSHVLVYPNYSAGPYYISVALDHAAPLSMAVYAADGRLISTQKVYGRTNYFFTGNLPTTGEYVITLQCGTSLTSTKLLIIK